MWIIIYEIESNYYNENNYYTSDVVDYDIIESETLEDAKQKLIDIIPSTSMIDHDIEKNYDEYTEINVIGVYEVKNSVNFNIRSLPEYQNMLKLRKKELNDIKEEQLKNKKLQKEKEERKLFEELKKKYGE